MFGETDEGSTGGGNRGETKEEQTERNIKRSGLV